ncbi:hypothetical protein [Demequina muriae]|uniref:DUF2178 domain-containing protein n=1 Tax=Demequina muriae TaxID=3051664 RepID=A0ABT8GGS8_9MICO|nr:hypothetical protein [Demequina sp. EGI L300058]MDN4480642.1 hypothetical protein [Demequina sp. EGI L300058]
MNAHELRQPEDDERAPMTMEERAVWVYLVVFVATSVAYFAVVVPRALSQPIDEVSWVVPMLWAIGISIGGTIIGSILAAVGSAIGLAARGRNPELELGSDERDKQIERLGNRATATVVSFGMLAVLVLAMIDADTFWIGNAAFLSGFVGALVEAFVKIRAYRRGF